MGQTYPLPITPAMLALANPDAGKPAYDSMDDWTGGTVGDDVNVSSAATTDPYAPVNQGHKAEIIGVPMAVDVTTPRGWIAPGEPYAPAPVPTLTEIDPTSHEVGPGDPFVLTVTGTGFLPGSVIVFGSNEIGERTTYVSPTTLTTIVQPDLFPNPDPAIPVKVRTADQESDSVDFAFTEPEEPA